MMTKKIALLTLSFLFFNQAFAQNNFKNPVRFKLKNDLTVIVAENVGSGKIFSRLTIEDTVNDEEKSIAKVVKDYLSARADEFNSQQFPDKRIISEISITPTEANTTSGIVAFEQTLAFVSRQLFDPELAAFVFSEMGTTYKGAQSDLKEIKLTDIENYLSAHLKTKDIYITIAGDISPANAKLITNRLFGELNPKSISSSK